MEKIDKPWGYEQPVIATQVEIGGKTGMLGIRLLVINVDEMTSYSYHEEQNDVLYVQEGEIVLKKEDEMKNLSERDAEIVRAGEKHQLQNIHSDVVRVLEVSFPYMPDDINRLEDPYREERS
jgi:mannose-6-phosphate isomerase-like protein (cupin superfamily)